LASLLDMNRTEKEQYVIQLYKENKSTREIAKLTHMSFRDIGIITKKVKLEADGERGPSQEDDNIKSKSKTTQALKLFSELKSPIEVTIELDLPTDQIPLSGSRNVSYRLVPMRTASLRSAYSRLAYFADTFVRSACCKSALSKYVYSKLPPSSFVYCRLACFSAA
jgi:hypothetical protein